MKKSKEVVSTVPFDDGDILTSRTDKRGVIQSGNRKFQELSGFSWEELDQAPHKIIRHDAMPKGVFWLLWNRLDEDKPTGFFAKNKPKGGGHYWAYAFVSPLEDGYLSVRIKPQVDAIREMDELYEEMLEKEKDEEFSPEQSAHYMLERLAEMGYPSFEKFMAVTAGEQLADRNTVIGQKVPTQLKDMQQLREKWTEIERLCHQIYDLRKLIAGTPINLRIQAKQLDARGGALGVIATNYTTLTHDILERMSAFLEKSKEMAGLLETGNFLMCMSEIQKQVVEAFDRGDAEAPGMDPKTEREAMVEQSKAFDMQADTALQRANDVFRVFKRYLTETERILSGLSVTRVMCKIENAYTPPDARTSIDGTVKLLQRFCDEGGDSLSQMRSHIEGAEAIAAQARRAIKGEPEEELPLAS